MVGRELPRRLRGRWLRVAWLPVMTARASAPYSPCPIQLDNPLPADAFDRCRAVMLSRFGALAVADEPSFLLQTPWTASDDLPGERRVAVFRDPSPADPAGLAVVVELRRLAEPLFGMPTWTAVRGDAATEREIAELLRQCLAVTPP